MKKLMRSLAAGVAGLALMCGVVGLLSSGAAAASPVPAAEASTALIKSDSKAGPSASAFDPEDSPTASGKIKVKVKRVVKFKGTSTVEGL